MGSAALEKSQFRSCDRHKPSTLPLWAWITLRRSYVSRLYTCTLSASRPRHGSAAVPRSHRPGYQRKCIVKTRLERGLIYRASCDATGQACQWHSAPPSPRPWCRREHHGAEGLLLAWSAWSGVWQRVGVHGRVQRRRVVAGSDDGRFRVHVRRLRGYSLKASVCRQRTLTYLLSVRGPSS